MVLYILSELFDYWNMTYSMLKLYALVHRPK